jgi:RES domain
LSASTIFRLYNSTGRDGSPRHPFVTTMSPDRRLSSVLHGIKMGYWAPDVASCFLEVFLRRERSEYRHKKNVFISRAEQGKYHIAEFHLSAPLNLYSIAQAATDGVIQSAIYSNQPEKDDFTKWVLEQGYDGIEFHSNQNKAFICYALFEATVDRIRIESLTAAGFMTKSLGDCPAIMVEIIDAFTGIADINFEG